MNKESTSYSYFHIETDVTNKAYRENEQDKNNFDDSNISLLLQNNLKRTLKKYKIQYGYKLNLKSFYRISNLFAIFAAFFILILLFNYYFSLKSFYYFQNTEIYPLFIGWFYFS